MLCLVASSLSLAPQLPPTRSCVGSSLTSLDAAAPISRRDALSGAAAAVVALGAAPLQAQAESTLVTRQQAYTRYVPRIERGRDFWANGLRRLIANSDWKTIEKELEPLGKKDKGGTIIKAFGPMRLWSSSWSGKVISDKTLAMNAAIDELEEAVASLSIAAGGQEKDTGFLSFMGGKKSLDEASRQKLAQAAYKKGTSAFNKFILIGNDGLGLSFAPLDTID